MRVRIYQINSERDVNRVKFHDLDLMEKYQKSPDVNPALYDEVFNGELDSGNLEKIFMQFNHEGHPLHRGHSISVSDVVALNGKAYFCQKVGFQEIPFDESKTQKPDNLMRVVYVEPNKPPYETEILHTLEAEQKAVGGLIEPIYMDDDTALVGNEEAKLIGMEGNRRLGDGSSIIAGPFFVVGLTEDDFRSLTDSEVTKYMNRFAEPEDISPEEVQADMGFTIYSGM
jgi:hypothetical protein